MGAATATAASVRWVPSTAMLGWALAATSLSLVAATLTVAVAFDANEVLLLYALVLATITPVVGALILARQPRNAVGWLLLLVGVFEGGVALANVWALAALDTAPGALPGGQLAAWLSDWLWIPAHAIVITFLPLLFPDGRLPSPRWRPVAFLAGLGLAVQLAAPASVLPQISLRTSYWEFYPDERVAELTGSVGYYTLVAVALLSITGLLIRLRRMPRGTRGAYVWFAGGAIVTVLLLLPVNRLITDPGVRELVRTASGIALPVGALVAIVRHRVYGIDVVVNRTLVYAGLSVVLVGVYLLAANLVTWVDPTNGTMSTLGGAAATALVLSPARDRVQRGVNQLMYGQRDDAGQVVTAIGERVSAIASASETLEDVAAQIAASLRLPYVALEVHGVTGPRVVAASGSPEGAMTHLPLVTGGEVVGHLVVTARRGQRRLSDRDRRALEDIARIAATAVRQVELTEDLRRSRERLAAALEEERRRIRRDLHDGLGPGLATIVMGLEETRAVHRADPERAERLLLDLKTQTRAAIDDVRSLVYGLRPPALDDLGLVGAVRQLVTATSTRTGLPLVLDAPDTIPELPAAVEVAAYRIAQEAVTNIVRHADATTARITISCADAALQLRISDDGCGLPDHLVAGVGVTSMRERVHDIGGTVQLSTDGGTVVEAVLPLEPSWVA
jgi:signal transduction histidine kinase